MGMKRLEQIVFSCLFCIFSVSASFVFGGELDEKTFIGEGVVVAFQKKERCASCKAGGGIGTKVEYWILRIDEWKEVRGERYVIVEYRIYDRSLSDDEINSRRLRFRFRERREDEHIDCLDEIVIRQEPRETRPVEISDYEFTKQQTQESVPLLQSLPCLIVEKVPVVVER